MRKDVCNCLSPAGKEKLWGIRRRTRLQGAGSQSHGWTLLLFAMHLPNQDIKVAQHFALSSSSQPQKRPHSPCSGELPAGNMPPTLRIFAVEAPRTPNPSSKTRFLENIQLVASEYWEKK